MPQRSWSKKRERQYTHIEREMEERGYDEDLAEEIASRTVNKERARSGEARTWSRSSVDDISSSRRGGIRSHQGPGGRTRDQLYSEAKTHEHPGTLEDDQGATRARRGPVGRDERHSDSGGVARGDVALRHVGAGPYRRFVAP